MSFISFIKQKTKLNLDYFISNSIWVGLRETITVLLGLITVAAVARLVPKEIYGHYQLILSIIATVSIFSIPGLNTAIIQSAARGYDGNYQRAVKTSFLWSIIASCILLLLGGYWLWQQNQLATPILLSALFFAFLYAPNTWESFLQGKAKFKTIAKYSTLKNVIHSSTFLLTILLFPENLTLIVLSHLVATTAINIFLYQRSLQHIKNKKAEKNTISYGFFITKISLLNILSAHLDKIIIAIFIGPIELAIYAMGINLIKKVTNLLKSFLSITTPIVSQKNTATRRNYLILFLLSLLLSIAVYVSIPLIVQILLSNNYNEAIPIARIIAVFIPFFVIGSQYKNHFTLFIKNKQILLIESVISPLIKIALILLLSFLLGVQGLAIAYGLQYITPTAVLFILSKIFPNKAKQPSF